MAKFAISAKITNALGLGAWASEQDVLARIHRLNDRTVDAAIESGRLEPGLREWARSNFTAFKELVANIPAGGLAQLARNRAAETGESLEEAQRAVVRANPELYTAHVAGGAIVDDDPRRQAIRHTASGQLATLTRMELARQGCGWDEATRITFDKHPELVRQYQTGRTDMPVEFDPASVPLIEQGSGSPTRAEQLVAFRKILGLPATASSDEINRAFAQWFTNPDGGTTGVPTA